METNYEINTLRETLRKYADAYYNEDAPLVTDTGRTIRMTVIGITRKL